MQGSIRMIVGFLTTLGAVGGIENSVTTPALLTCVGIALFGLLILASGIAAMRKEYE